VCSGSDTQVTYTYEVTNTGTAALTGTVVDDNGTPGNTGDDVTVGTFTGLAPGASQQFTHAFTVNGTTTNTATASGTSAGGQTATDSTSATVNAHDCTISITKSPSVDNVCIGSDTEVTYTITVTNNSDLFDWTGDVTDTVLGTLATGVTIAAGESVTYTPTHTVNATTMNTVTADGAFNDTDASAATDSANATVTAHDCTISITKSPSVSDVCTGSDTEVTYTYVVTNNSDFYSVSGSVTDDVLGSIGTFTNLAPGASTTLIKVATINATTTNTATVTGTFNDSASSTDSDTASATVTGHICDISITKTASPTTICVGAGTQVTYTYVVKNEGDVTLNNVSVVDDKLGTIASGQTLAPGESKTFTTVATISTTTTNTVTASGIAFGTTVTDTASATVTVGTTPCPLTPGYWKNHLANSKSSGPFFDTNCRKLPSGTSCSTNGPWAKQFLPKTLGNYNVDTILKAAQVFAKMNCSNTGTNSKQNQNAIGCLAGHLLAAKLNVANGAANAA
jgi:uncharacterized repeat protein (TIGR01451 family)